MNAEIIFNEFAKFAESNNHYYTFEKHGIIEDVLAFMGLPSKNSLVQVRWSMQIIWKPYIIS